MIIFSRILYFILMLSIAIGASSPAFAEHADKDKPIKLEADRVTIDDAKNIHTFEGRVTLIQGTLTIKADKVVVTQDIKGFQKGIAYGDAKNPASFRTKRDKKDEYIDGRALRIEHDSQLETTEFFDQAFIKSGADEVNGQYILYDNKAERYLVANGPRGTVQTEHNARVHATIQPKNKENRADSAPPSPSHPPIHLKIAPGIINSK